MSLYHAERDVALHLGPSLDVLRELPAASVNCVVTSPPYFGLRDYGLEPTEWPAVEYRPMPGLPTVSVPAAKVCLGLEPDPWQYVGHLVLIFRELRRVLRPDGTLWLNVGDSYSGRANGGATFDRHRGSGHRAGVVAAQINTTAHAPYKSLLGVPWRLAFALMSEGWTVRNDIDWYKPNGMPESVRDRLSSRHEDVFLMTRSQRYHFDLSAIAENYIPQAGLAASFARQTKEADVPGQSYRQHRLERQDASPLSGPRTKNPGDVWSIPTQPFAGAHFAVMPPALAARCILAGCPEGGVVLDPFVGSGTVPMVARRAGRIGWGIDLKAEFLDLAIDRIGQDTFEIPAPGPAAPPVVQLALDEEISA